MNAEKEMYDKAVKFYLRAVFAKKDYFIGDLMFNVQYQPKTIQLYLKH